MINQLIQSIPEFHKNRILLWKQSGIVSNEMGFLGLVEQNHAFNLQLWQAEDRARRNDKGFEYVFQAKREIDQYNQQRNDRMEAMDQWLFQALKPASHSDCPVHSETPGMMIDRLSILALKAYHMGLQVERQDVDSQHRETCKHKLTIILAQKAQLQTCLEELIKNVQEKQRTFRIYHQFKMYNDPTLVHFED